MINLPWLVPGLVVAIIASILAAPRLGRALGSGTLLAAVMVFAFGLIVSATLTPQSEALDYGIRSGGTCDLTLTGLSSLSDLLTPNEISLNILLFIPLGATLGMLPRSRRKAAVIVAAVLLPFVIEWIQLVTPVLDRACEASDIIDNVAGLVLGLAIGSVGVRVVSVLAKVSHREG